MKLRQIILHVTGVILFLILPMFIYPRPHDVGILDITNPGIRNLLSNLFMVVFFYLNYYYLIPKIFLPRQYILYGVIIFASLIVITYLPAYITEFLHLRNSFPDGPPPGNQPPGNQPTGPNGSPQGPNFLVMISHIILLYVSVVLFSILLRVRERLYASEKAKNQMELISLKDQINPHFLFNTLNNIYSTAIRDKLNDTATSILKLSGLMRYVVEETKSQYVPLQKEIEYLDNYIQLQRQRLDKSVDLEFIEPDRVSPDLSIAPLILIPFIENAFKHGINPDEKSNIKIELSLNENTLLMWVTNQKVHLSLAHHEVSGKGIAATKARLELLYPKRYQLILEDTDTMYQVKLQLELHDEGNRDR